MAKKEKDKEKEIKQEIPETEETVEETAETEEIEETVEDLNEESETELLKKEIDRLKNDYARAYADTENLKKRLMAEAEQTRKYRIQSFAKEVLPVIDNLERALQSEVEEADEGFKKGVQMIYDQLLGVLKNLGCEPMKDLVGTPFDPHFHDAMAHVEDETLGENVIAQVFQTGYIMKEIVIRAALVRVAN